MAPHIEYCRSCMTENLVGGTNLADSYNAYCGEDIDFATMFHKTTNINPLEDDFSNNLCEFCTDSLRIAFEFRSQSWVSQNILVNIYRTGHGAGKHQLQMRPLVKIERLDTETADDDVPMHGYSFESRLKRDEENILKHHDNTFGLASNDIESLSDLNQTVNKEVSATEENITLVPSDSEIFVSTVTCVTENETYPNESSYAEPIKASKILTNEKTNAENSTKNAALGYYPCHAIGCTRTFFNPSERRKHRNEMQAQGDESHMFKCTECAVFKHSNARLRTHISSMHTEVTCKLCNMKLVRYDYRRHLLQKHEKDKSLSSCSHCGKNFDGYRTMLSHKKRCRFKNAIIESATKDFYANDCEIKSGIFCPSYGCNMLFSRTDLLEKHLNEMKDSPNHKYRCDICKLYLSNRKSITAHMNKKHIAVSCEDCLRLFRNESLLIDHKRRKHNKGTYQCPECKKVCINATYLKYHLKAEHGLSHLPLASVETVGETSAVEEPTSIEGEIRKECEPADEKTAQSRSKSINLKIKCYGVNCNKLFHTATERNRHVEEMQALGEANHILACTICGVERDTPYNLKHHMLSHKKVTCKICHKTVSVPTYKTHIQKEHCGFARVLRKWPCPDCEKVVDGFDKLMSHRAKYHEIEAVITNASKDFYAKDTLTQGIFCPAYGCNMLFSSNKLVKEHLKDMNGSPNHTYSCDICNRNLNVCVYKNVYNHISRSHIPVPCEECDEILPSRYMLIIHKKKFHNTNTRECPNCKQLFSNSRNLNDHLNRKVCTKSPPLQYKGYMCPAPGCRKIYKVELSYKGHMSKYCGMPGHLYQCDFCQMEFDTKLKIRQHLANHVKLPFHKKCQICDKPFLSHAGLRFHLLTEHVTNKDELKYSCETCGEKFTSRLLCDQHWRQTHRTKKQKSFLKCNLCEKEFSRKDNLRRHIEENHIKEKNYSCTICGKLFVSMGVLKKHERYHSTETVACHICGKMVLQHRFGFHVRSHVKEECECKVCHKKFNHTTTLRVHMYSHLEKTLKCQFCEVRTRTASQLQSHINQVHNKIKKFRCTHEGCNEMFIRSFERKTHIRKDHLKKESVYKQRRFSDKGLRCTYENCERTFVWKCQLDLHIHVSHLGYTTKSYREKFGYKRLDGRNEKVFKNKIAD